VILKRHNALIFLVVLLLAASLLVACQGGNGLQAGKQTAGVESPAPDQSQPSSTSVQEDTPTVEQESLLAATATLTPEVSSEGQTPALEWIMGETMPGCTVVSFNPTPEPTLQAIFPPPGENDWVMGPDTASVTITEYSDFQ